MIKKNIETIVKDYDFLSVNSTCHPGTIFAGVLGACSKNLVIFHVLDHIYKVDINEIDAHPHLTCEEMYKAIKCGLYSDNFKLYREWREDQSGDKIYNDDGEIIFMHYPFSKIIPRI